MKKTLKCSAVRCSAVRAALLGLLALAGAAQAQVGQMAAPVLANPLFSGAKKSVGGALTLPNGVGVLLNERSGYLLSATVVSAWQLPAGAPATVSVSGGTATVQATGQASALTTAAGISQASAAIGALSGFGDGMAQPLSAFLSRGDVIPRLPAGVKIVAEPYLISAQLRGKILRLTIAPNQVATTSFAKGMHVQAAKKPSAQPVVLRIYSDFECPYCRQFETQTLPPLMAQLPADVSVEFHQFPLESLHSLARPAAEASECAAQQGKFWEYKDALFAERQWLNGNPNTAFIAQAVKLKLDAAKFKNCLAERGGKAAVDAGLSEAAQLGLNATPTVFINGFKAANPYDVAGLLKLVGFARVAAGASAAVLNPPLASRSLPNSSLPGSAVPNNKPKP